LRQIILGLAPVGNRQSDRGANLDVEDPLIACNSSAFAAPDISAKINYVDPVEALSKHFAQAGVWTASKECSV
jgi:hypothetical protein